MIVSKLNGKALYCKDDDVGMFVRATERNDDDESQHWIREGTNIVSKKLKKVFYNNSYQLCLADLKTGNDDHKTFTIKEVSLHGLDAEVGTNEKIQGDVMQMEKNTAYGFLPAP